MNRPPIAQVLPREAAQALQDAAYTPTDYDPLARQKAVERMTAKVKATYPRFFQQEQDHETEYV